MDKFFEGVFSIVVGGLVVGFFIMVGAGAQPRSLWEPLCLEAVAARDTIEFLEEHSFCQDVIEEGIIQDRLTARDSIPQTIDVPCPETSRHLTPGGDTLVCTLCPGDHP